MKLIGSFTEFGKQSGIDRKCLDRNFLSFPDNRTQRKNLAMPQTGRFMNKRLYESDQS